MTSPNTLTNQTTPDNIVIETLHRGMKFEDGSPTKAGEWEVDFSVVQLLDTSANFRQWLVAQVAPKLDIEEYIGGIIHSNYAGEGESDIEFGFRTATGERHLVMIENKIDAPLQRNQVERYYKRGQFRVNQGDWDSFTVCLLAPERYVSEENKSEFESVIHYEVVLDILEELTHDSAGFFQAVIKSTEQKSVTTDASGVLQSIADDFRSTTGITELYQSVDYKKRIAFRSSHPQHPDEVQYDVYIAETGDNGRSVVRLQIVDADSLTKERRDTIESIVSQHIESLPDYNPTLHRKKNIAVKDIRHNEVVQNSSYDTYPIAVADELHTLTKTFHPLFVNNSFS